jgi:glycine/D-amino acid oxidase-like deaminating enzyme
MAEPDRSWWLREALAADPGRPCPPLSGARRADVAILGGGYTGMWTAYQLKRADPAAEVVLLEADICGAGPSGRNGGFMYGLWEDFANLVHLFGLDDALRVARAAESCVDMAADVFSEAGIDIWFRRAGHIDVSTSTVFDQLLTEQVASTRRYEGFPPDLFKPLSAAEVAARCRSPRFRAGVLQTRGATVQPARLARGLRRLILDLGVHVFESTPATTIESGDRVRITTPAGEVAAERAVLALNAWSNQVPEMRRRIIPRASHIVLTEPAPDRLAEIGWTGGEAISDLRATVHYLRTTPDGRIAFGAGTGTAASTVDDRLSKDAWWRRRLEAELREWFPEFRGVRIDAAWGGPVDVSPHHVPFFGSTMGGKVHYAAGFTGAGVGPSVLAGRILASLALGRQDEYSTLALARYTPKRFPPEPLLSIGARITLQAILRTDDAWAAGRKGNVVLRQVARMPRRLGYSIGH